MKASFKVANGLSQGQAERIKKAMEGDKTNRNFKITINYLDSIGFSLSVEFDMSDSISFLDMGSYSQIMVNEFTKLAMLRLSE